MNILLLRALMTLTIVPAALMLAALRPAAVRPVALTPAAVPPTVTTFTVGPKEAPVRFRGVSAVSDRVAWASGTKGTIVRTADGGSTWQTLAVPASDAEKLDFRDVDAIDDRIAYALSIGPGEASRIYKTIDAGAHWDLQFTNHDPKAFFDAMTFADATHGIVMSDSVDGQFVIMQTSDGRTWTRVPPAALPAALPNEGAFAASGTNVAMIGRAHIWIGTGAASTARVLRSSDGGRNWKAFSTPIPAGPSAGIFSIAFRDEMHGVIVGGDYKQERAAIDNVAITSDGGATWTLVREHALGGFRSAVAYLPDANGKRTTSIFAAGPAGADISHDDGRTWQPFDVDGLHTVSVAGRRRAARATVWGAGERGRIVRIDGFGKPAKIDKPAKRGKKG
jgi:photosystem II stability/assembly factor-like uncharacterized protein